MSLVLSLPLSFGPSVARPAAALALVLPLLFLVLLRLLARPPEIATGTLALWKELAPSSQQGVRRRGEVPPWAWCCAAGLLLGALAGMGLRGARAAAPREWNLVLDLSPSMGLETGAGTRLEGALVLAETWLDEAAGRGDRVRWRARGREPLELGLGARPPAWWLAVDPDGVEPRWALHDQPGTLWVSDARPRVEPRHAGLFLSGGPAVEGPVATEPGGLVTWQGGELVRVSARPPGNVLVREASGVVLVPLLEDVLRAWCAARGHALTRALVPGAVLVVDLQPGPSSGAESGALRLGRDGWSAMGRGVLAPRTGDAALDAGEEWLFGVTSAGLTVPVVSASEGRIRIGLRELGEPQGDPARFAVSWAQLFDRWAGPAPGVIALAERRSAGEPRVRPGAPPLRAEGVDLGPLVDASLALGAALCVCCALFLRR